MNLLKIDTAVYKKTEIHEPIYYTRRRETIHSPRYWKAMRL
jgi:hypothetical protein